MQTSRHSKYGLKTGLGRGLIGGLVLGALAIMVHQVWAAPGKGRLFASDPERNDLLQIRTANGRAFFLRDVGLPAGSLAVDVRDATLDALYLGQGVGASKLYVIDASTDSVRLVGDTGLGSQATLHGLDFLRRDATTDAFSFPATGSDGKPAPGRLLAAMNLSGSNDTGADHLVELDGTTGYGLVVGAFGVDGVEALAFDRHGTLWASVTAAGGDTPGLYTVDPDDGLATFYAGLDNAGPNGPPGAPSGGVTALQFACDGRLFGGTGAVTGGSGASTTPTGGLPILPGSGPISVKSGPVAGSGGGPISGGGGPAGGYGAPEDPGAGGATVDEGGRLVTIDPVTGYFVYAGNQAVSGGDLGGFAFEDACPTLFAPTPGVAGTSNTLAFVGASSEGRVRLFASRSTGTTGVAVPGCGVLSLGLANAKARGTVQADAEGQATFELGIPRGFEGDTVYFQAIDRASCTVSNLGAHRFR